MSPGRPHGACISGSGLPACGPPSAPLSLEAVKQSIPGRKFQKDLLSQWLLSKCRVVGKRGGSPGGSSGFRDCPLGAGKGRLGGENGITGRSQGPQGYPGRRQPDAGLEPTDSTEGVAQAKWSYAAQFQPPSKCGSGCKWWWPQPWPESLGISIGQQMLGGGFPNTFKSFRP